MHLTTSKLQRTTPALAAVAAAALATALTAAPALAQRPDPPGSPSPSPVRLSPWVIIFTGEGKVVVPRSVD